MPLQTRKGSHAETSRGNLFCAGLELDLLTVEDRYRGVSLWLLLINVMCDFFMQWRSLPYLICATKQIGIISEGSPSCIR